VSAARVGSRATRAPCDRRDAASANEQEAVVGRGKHGGRALRGDGPPHAVDRGPGQHRVRALRPRLTPEDVDGADERPIRHVELDAIDDRTEHPAVEDDRDGSRSSATGHEGDRLWRDGSSCRLGTPRDLRAVRVDDPQVREAAACMPVHRRVGIEAHRSGGRRAQVPRVAKGRFVDVARARRDEGGGDQGEQPHVRRSAERTRWYA
jgi:hypothetical protein